MCCGRDVHDVEELKRQGLSIRAISRLTGYCRKTVRKYLIQPDIVPVYGPRSKQPGRLEPFKPYLEERMGAGIWNARVLLRELRERGYSGGYTLDLVEKALSQASRVEDRDNGLCRRREPSTHSGSC